MGCGSLGIHDTRQFSQLTARNANGRCRRSATMLTSSVQRYGFRTMSPDRSHAERRARRTGETMPTSRLAERVAILEKIVGVPGGIREQVASLTSEMTQ